MKYIDLSHQIYDGMPTYPSDPDVSIKLIKSINNNNSLLHEFSMGTHTGTHLDVPAHIIPNGKTISDYSLESFFGTAILINSKKVGGLASGAQSLGGNALYLGDKIYNKGLIGIALSGDIEIDTIVAQGCRPIGEPMKITDCQDTLLK